MSTNSSNGFTSNNYSYLRCWVILNSDGKKVFQYIFTWGFPRPQNEIKDALFDLPNYSNSKYRSDFNTSQRQLINTGADLNEFDLGLFYLLLQRICSLPPMPNIAWLAEGDPDCLPNVLYRIKMLRNDLAHSDVEMNESDSVEAILLYKFLFNKALELAANVFGIDNNTLVTVKESVNTHITGIETSSEVQIHEIVKEIIVKEDVGLSEKELKIAHVVKSIPNTFKDDNLAFVKEKVPEEVKPIIESMITLKEKAAVLENNFKPTIEATQELVKAVKPALSKAVDDVSNFFGKIKF